MKTLRGLWAAAVIVGAAAAVLGLASACVGHVVENTQVGSCVIDKDCETWNPDPAHVQCQTGTCREGMCSYANHEAGTACLSAGAPAVCFQGACTPGVCVVDRALIEDGHAGTDPCTRCDTTQALTSLVPVSCPDNLTEACLSQHGHCVAGAITGCTLVGCCVYDPSWTGEGPQPRCDLGSAQGYCSAQGLCYGCDSPEDCNDGAACRTWTCTTAQTCVGAPADQGACTVGNDPGMCILGTCYTDACRIQEGSSFRVVAGGASKPGDPCMYCDPARDRTQYIAVECPVNSTDPCHMVRGSCDINQQGSDCAGLECCFYEANTDIPAPRCLLPGNQDGVCQDGECVGCLEASDCTGTQVCGVYDCNTDTHVCFGLPTDTGVCDYRPGLQDGICRAGSCMKACATQVDCFTGQYCTARGHCEDKLLLGDSCSDDYECLSDNCATTCTGVPDCMNDIDCPGNYYCDLAAPVPTCKSPLPDGATCSGPSPVHADRMCLSGYCQPTTQVSPPDEGDRHLPGRCEPIEPCSGDTDCDLSTYYCGAGGICLLDRINGVQCGREAQCLSTICADAGGGVFRCAGNTCPDCQRATGPGGSCVAADQYHSDCDTCSKCQGGACVPIPALEQDNLTYHGTCMATAEDSCQHCDGAGQCITATCGTCASCNAQGSCVKRDLNYSGDGCTNSTQGTSCNYCSGADVTCTGTTSQTCASACGSEDCVDPTFNLSGDAYCKYCSPRCTTRTSGSQPASCGNSGSNNCRQCSSTGACDYQSGLRSGCGINSSGVNVNSDTSCSHCSSSSGSCVTSNCDSGCAGDACDCNGCNNNTGYCRTQSCSGCCETDTWGNCTDSNDCTGSNSCQC